MFKIRITKS